MICEKVDIPLGNDIKVVTWLTNFCFAYYGYVWLVICAEILLGKIIKFGWLFWVVLVFGVIFEVLAVIFTVTLTTGVIILSKTKEKSSIKKPILESGSTDDILSVI